MSVFLFSLVVWYATCIFCMQHYMVYVAGLAVPKFST